MPPPHTTRSNAFSATVFFTHGFSGCVPVVRQTASHRASKPVRSWSAIRAVPASRRTAPAGCHRQSPEPVPSSFGSAVPFTSTWNVPAACALHGAVQLRV